MDELNEYGAFNKRYEGAGELQYTPGPCLPVYFEVRQLVDGRLLVGCVSTTGPIRDGPVAISGHLLSGERFDTIWGRGITEMHRSSRDVAKAHYIANMTRVRYTKDAQPDNHSVQFALHNFIPGPSSDVSANKFNFKIGNRKFILFPVNNYRDQADRLRRHGGNIRTSWMRTNLRNESGDMHLGIYGLDEIIAEISDALSLAIGTLVTCPQRITFDVKEDRNDVERYSTEAKAFSTFIPVRGWDTPIEETVAAWFSTPKSLPCFGPKELSVWVRQHLDACATDIYLETRALAAATLLDVVAGRYRTVWAPDAEPGKQPYFRERLRRLLTDLEISLSNKHLSSIIDARNSLVHAGKFVSSEHDKIFQNLVRLGRCILLRVAGFPSKLHEGIEA